VDDVDAGFGLNVPVAPLGSPLALRLTAPLNPLVGVMDTEYDVDPPACGKVWLDGDAFSEKSGVADTPQPASLNVPMRVCQLKAPFEARYSFVYQNVQSSDGSTLMLE
jgi:hypothetical protein